MSATAELERTSARSVRGRAGSRGLAIPGLPHWVAIAGALACWTVALGRTHPEQVSGFGLLGQLPPEYFAGLILLAASFAVAALREADRPVLLAAHLIALIVIVHATTAVLYPEPRYTWTYKHIGVVEYIATHGRVDRSVDIYQNWPGFFALNAWLSRVTGMSPVNYAGWAQVAFALANVSGVMFVVRGLTRDRRLPWVAAWLFLLANWIGQDYLAPQAVAFFLALVVFGLVIRCSPWGRPPRTRLGLKVLRLSNTLAGRLSRRRVARPRESADPPLSGRAALLVGGLCFVALLVSHPLSPFMVIAALVVLIVATRRPPVWVVGLMLGATAVWVALGFDFVTSHFKLLDFGQSASARVAPAGADLPGVAVGLNTSRGVIALLVVIAAVGFLRRRRMGYWDSIPLAFIGGPALLVLGQSYDGEGPLRAYLFALPFLCFFAAAACLPREGRVGPGGAWRLLAASLVIGAGGLFGYFGQEPVNYVTSPDVATSRWFYDHAPRGATLTYAAPNFPDRVGAGYADHLDAPRALTNDPRVRANLSGAAQSGSSCDQTCALRRDVTAFLERGGPRRAYLVISPSQERYTRFHGLAPAGALGRLTRALTGAPGFTPVFRRDGATIFAWTPPPP